MGGTKKCGVAATRNPKIVEVVLCCVLQSPAPSYPHPTPTLATLSIMKYPTGLLLKIK